MEDIQLSTFRELLKAFRAQRRMTQQELATRIGSHRNTIGSWERGDVLPESKTIVLEVAHQLRLDTQETRRLLEASLTALSAYWLLPAPRNPFFTGREEVLRQLHNALAQEYSAVLSQSYALSGLGALARPRRPSSMRIGTPTTTLPSSGSVPKPQKPSLPAWLPLRPSSTCQKRRNKIRRRSQLPSRIG